MGLFYGYV